MPLYSNSFLAKIGEVNHHQLTAGGNVGFEPYEIYYCNVADSVNRKKMKVKFLGPKNQFIKYYVWSWGDGTPDFKTISPEVEHDYDVTTRYTYLTQSGVLPHTPTKLGIWTNVVLTVYYDDSNIGDDTWTGEAAIYEITGDVPIPPKIGFMDIVYGDGKTNPFVAIDSWGKIYSSIDGLSWTLRYTGTSQYLYFIRCYYLNNKFIVIGTLHIISSDDGVTWVENTNLTAISDITYGTNPGLYLATTGPSYPYNAKVYTSADLTTWNLQYTFGGGAVIPSCTYNTDLNIFAVYDGGYGYIMTSPDGTTWPEHIYDAYIVPISWTILPTRCLYYLNGLYLIMYVQASIGKVVYSSDLVNWTIKEIIDSLANTLGYPQNILYSSSKYYFSGRDLYALESGAVFSTADLNIYTRVTHTDYATEATAYNSDNDSNVFFSPENGVDKMVTFYHDGSGVTINNITYT